MTLHSQVLCSYSADMSEFECTGKFLKLLKILFIHIFSVVFEITLCFHSTGLCMYNTLYVNCCLLYMWNNWFVFNKSLFHKVIKFIFQFNIITQWCFYFIHYYFGLNSTFSKMHMCINKQKLLTRYIFATRRANYDERDACWLA